MQKSILLSVLLTVLVFITSPVIAIEVPDMHLKSEAEKAQDATLIIPNNNGDTTAKEYSSLEVFVNTLLGKNIGNLSPAKEHEE